MDGDPRGRQAAGDGLGPLLTRRRFLRGVSGAGLGLAFGGAAALAAAGEFGRAAGSAAFTAPTVRRFHSRPDLVPPTVQVAHHGDATAPGALFLAPSSGPGQRGTLIMNDRGEPLWFRPSTPVSAMNFRVASAGGRSLLTWWEGKTEHGLGVGTHLVADEHYRVLARIPAAGGLASDLHEFILTPNGTLLLTAWELAERDLSALGGSRRGVVVGGVVQELAYPSGKLLFEWHSLDHVAPSESYVGVGNPFDYFHINSIAPTDDGNLIVSARNTWAVYKLDRGSGEVIWRLGGTRSDFTMGPNTLFAWQHDARPHPGDLVSLFDDGAAPQVQPQSRGLVLALDTRRMRARFDRAYSHSPPLLADALGSFQLLPNGNALVGYGTEPYLTEYSAAGDVLLDARLPPQGENYRALRFPWVGRPLDPPTLVTSAITGTNRLYVSWNGATEVDTWLLRAGRTADALADVARVPRAGFESSFELPPRATHALATALDASGAALARSPTIRL